MAEAPTPEEAPERTGSIEAQLQEANLIQAQLQKANLEGAQLEGAALHAEVRLQTTAAFWVERTRGQADALRARTVE